MDVVTITPSEMDTVNPKQSSAGLRDTTDVPEEDCEVDADGSFEVISRECDRKPYKKATYSEKENGGDENSDLDSIEERLSKLLSNDEGSNQMILQMKEMLLTMISTRAFKVASTSDGARHRETDESNEDQRLNASNSNANENESPNEDGRAGEAGPSGDSSNQVPGRSSNSDTNTSNANESSNGDADTVGEAGFSADSRNQVPSGDGNGRGFNFQEFVHDYYTSLHKVSQYIIGACLLAFVLLCLYSCLTHHQAMEMFKEKGKQDDVQQSILAEASLRHENFREGLIHERYEETRNYRNYLKMCNSGKDELFAKIIELEKEVSYMKGEKTKWQMKLDGLQSEIVVRESLVNERHGEIKEYSTSLKMCNSDKNGLLANLIELEKKVSHEKSEKSKWQMKLDVKQSETNILESRIRDLQATNRDPSAENRQSVTSTYSKIVVAFLQNEPIQNFAFGIWALLIVIVTFSHGTGNEP